MNTKIIYEQENRYKNKDKSLAMVIIILIIMILLLLYFANITDLIKKELIVFIHYKFVKLNVENSLMLNISIACFFIFFLKFPYKVNEEKTLLNIGFTDSLRGVAMFIIVMHHVSRFTVDPTDLLFFFDLGFIGAGCYLFLSGYGLMESYKKKGISNTFIQERFFRIFISVFLINSLIILINYITSQDNNNIIQNIATVLGIINLNWFIGFIIFWYLLFYICFKANLTNNTKIIIILLTSLIIMSSDSIIPISRINALSFPVGILFSNYKSQIQIYFQKTDQNKLKMNYLIFGLLSLIVIIFFIGLFINNNPLDQTNPFPSSKFILHEPLSYFTLRLFLIVICCFSILSYIIFKRSEIKIKHISNLIIFIFFVIISTPWFPRGLFPYLMVNSISLIAIVILITILNKVLNNKKSLFFSLWGRMSLELLLVHSYFLNTYLFILFKLPVQYSIIFFIFFVTIVSYLFMKISEFIQRKISILLAYL